MSMVGIRDGLFLCLCVIFHFIYRYRRRRLVPYPPGPRRWPIFKNTFTIPLTNAHGFYKDLGDRLGDNILHYAALYR